VLALIMGGGLRLALIGSGLGLIGAFGIDRVLRSVSSEFSASGFGLVAMIALLLLLVTLVACWLPARRAARVNPVNSLRAE
jgi:ABC-type antimicrobial peptide transport system permease subunit